MTHAIVHLPACIGEDPTCPCQDGDACHYKTYGDSPAMPLPSYVTSVFTTTPTHQVRSEPDATVRPNT